MKYLVDVFIIINFENLNSGSRKALRVGIIKFYMMKKVILISCLVILSLSFIFNSCKKETTNPSGNFMSTTNNQFDIRNTNDNEDDFLLIERTINPNSVSSISLDNLTDEMSILITNETVSDVNVFMAGTPEETSSSDEEIVEGNSEKVILLKDIGIDQIKQKLNIKNNNSNTDAFVKIKVFSNPYEYFGILYEEALKQIISNPQFPNINMKECYNYINSYIEKRIKDSQNLPITIDDKIDNITEISIDFNLSEVAELYYEKGLINFKQKNIYNNINTIIQTSKNIDILDLRLKNYERSIYYRNDLTLEEKVPLLGTSSIIRRSAREWYNFLLTPPNLGNMLKSWPRWLGGSYVIEADCEDGLGGPNGDEEIHFNLEHHVCLWGLVDQGWTGQGTPLSGPC